MPRPPVDVVVPFRGDLGQLAALQEQLGRLRLAAGDSLLVVDNTPGREPSGFAERSVLRAGEIATPAYARNRGAAEGNADWIAFLDADVSPEPDLLDRLFDPPPAERTALLAGGVRDEEVPPGGRSAAESASFTRARGDGPPIDVERQQVGAPAAPAGVRPADPTPLLEGLSRSENARTG